MAYKLHTKDLSCHQMHSTIKGAGSCSEKVLVPGKIWLEIGWANASQTVERISVRVGFGKLPLT